MINSFNLKENIDYPEIDNQGRNPQIVRLLYNLYAGEIGELNAVLQYSYQYSVLKKSNNETARLFKALSIVDMQYLELLANAIIQFGGLPYYMNSRGKAYSTKDVFYCTNVLHILKRDILDTKRSLQLYIQSINRIRNVSLKRLLMRIAEEKKLQIVALEVAYQRELKNSQMLPNKDNGMHGGNYLDNMPNFDDFSHDEIFDNFNERHDFDNNYEDDYYYHDCNCGDKNYNDDFLKDYDMQKLESKTNSNAPEFIDMNNQEKENNNNTPTLFGE